MSEPLRASEREGGRGGTSGTFRCKNQSRVSVSYRWWFRLLHIAHAQFILKMAAVQGSMGDTDIKTDIKTEPSADGFGNNNANDGRALSASPGSSASTGSNKQTAPVPTEDQQTLLAVLQFLKKNKLTESVEILRREAGLPENSLNLKGSETSGAGAAGSVDLEGADACSLLSRVTGSSSVGAQAPTKGTVHSECRRFNV